MAGVITLLDQPRTLDALGRATDAIIYFYYTGTTVLAPIYNDEGLTDPAANPVDLAAGEIFPDIFLDPEVSYRRRILYGDGSIHDVDPLPISLDAGLRQDLASSTGGMMVGFKRSSADAVLRDTQRKFEEMAVSVKDFGAVGDGVANDTAAIQKAVNFCKTQSSFNSGTFGGGVKALYYPQGVYLVDDTIALTSLNGFTMFGDGPQASAIVFTATGKTLFNWNTYLKCKVRDMSLLSGSVAIVGGKPTFTGNRDAGNVCCNYNSTSSGAFLTYENVNFAYWGTVERSKDSILNGDNHQHNNCTFYVNGKVWDNTNIQAVVWSYTDCLFYSNLKVFVYPGAALKVRGGDSINPGDFLTVGLTSTSLSLLFDGMNFENFQNQDPASTPRFIVSDGTAGWDAVFRNCRAQGGGTLDGKTSAAFSGLFRLVIENSYFTGTWDVTASQSANGVMSTLIIRECSRAPNINIIPQAGQGNRPINLIYDRHYVGGGYGTVNRNFLGALFSQSTGLGSSGFTDTFRFQAAALNAATATKSCPIFMQAPYVVQLVGAEIEWTNNTANTVTIDIWESSAKATKLATINTVAASGQYQNLEIPLSGILARYQITEASPALFVEVTAAGNAGACAANIGLKFRQVN